MRRKWTKGIAVLTAASLWMMTTGTVIRAEEPAPAQTTVEETTNTNEVPAPVQNTGSAEEKQKEAPSGETEKPAEEQKSSTDGATNGSTDGSVNGSGTQETSTKTESGEDTAANPESSDSKTEKTDAGSTAAVSGETTGSGTETTGNGVAAQESAEQAGGTNEGGQTGTESSGDNNTSSETQTGTDAAVTEGQQVPESAAQNNTGSEQKQEEKQETAEDQNSDGNNDLPAGQNTEETTGSSEAEKAEDTEGTDSEEQTTGGQEAHSTEQNGEGTASADANAAPAGQEQQESENLPETQQSTASQEATGENAQNVTEETTQPESEAAAGQTAGNTDTKEKLPVLAANDNAGAAGKSVKREAPRELQGDTEKTSTTLTIDWDDDDDRDDVRPGGVFANLVRKDASGNTEKIGTVILTENGYELNVNGTNYSGTKSEEDASWSFTITDLQAAGNVTYEWQQDDLDREVVGYAKSMISTQAEKEGTTTIITYKHVPAMASQTVKVVWDDDNNSDGTRPSSINVRLSNGEVLTLTEGSNWNGSIDDLPMYSAGERIEYIWTDEGVVGYYLATEEISGTDTILTYKKIPTITETTTDTQVEVTTITEIIGEPKYTLTIRYWDGDKKAFTDYTAYYEQGDAYRVTSPGKTGYSVDQNTVSGVIRTNTVVNVYYTARSYQVTVLYRFMDGSTAAPAYRKSIATGQKYSIASPAIAGYTVNLKNVTGTVSGQNMTYVVYYDVAKPAPVYVTTDDTGSGGQTIEISEYETPLGVGNVSINAGDCFE